MKKNYDLGLLLIRMAIGFPMLVYGISKIFSGIGFITNLLADKGLPQQLGYGVYLGEVVAPFLILIGFRTRLATIVFTINCITAIILVQTANIFKLNDSGGWALELLAMYTLVALCLFLTGSGKFAISTNNKWD